MKKNNKKRTPERNSAYFLTLPEIKMLKAFGDDWETILTKIYDKIFQEVKERSSFLPIECESLVKQNAIKNYFEWKGFSVHTASGKPFYVYIHF